MKRNLLLLLTVLMIAVCASAQIMVCGVFPDENGHFDTPYIKGGTVTWDEASHTLILDDAVIEYSGTPSDNVRPIRVTDDATIVVQGECKLTTNGYVAIGFDSYNSKNVTIKGNGTLYTSSTWIDFFLLVTHLTIQDITLQTTKGIANNSEGVGIALTFDNVQARISGEVSRIGDGITFRNCAITYPEDAYIEKTGYGYGIYCGDHHMPDYIVISRTGNIPGDVNGDGTVNIADLNVVINAILSGNSNMACDVNGDNAVNIADVNAIINIILGGTAPTQNHEYVDLGLPSGTLWATCNIGAKSPEQSGDFFAWGETTPKEVYNWSTYKWCNGSDITLTKYCIHSSCGADGFTDGMSSLDPEDDAAYVNWGPQWRMPTSSQLGELKDKCTWTWTTSSGVNGHLVTGPNGNSIFLPAAGGRYDSSLNDAGSHGFYWSHVLGSGGSSTARNLYFYSDGVYWGNGYRSGGQCVRAVRVAQN